MNTAKLHIDKNQRGGSYIWIDPPWTLTRHGRIVASSATYPDHQARDYRKLHDEWCSQFGDVWESQICAIKTTVEGSLKVDIENGFSFEASADTFQSENVDDWYDHWYVRIANESSEQTTSEKALETSTLEPSPHARGL